MRSPSVKIGTKGEIPYLWAILIPKVRGSNGHSLNLKYFIFNFVTKAVITSGLGGTMHRVKGLV